MAAILSRPEYVDIVYIDSDDDNYRNMTATALTPMNGN